MRFPTLRSLGAAQVEKDGDADENDVPFPHERGGTPHSPDCRITLPASNCRGRERRYVCEVRSESGNADKQGFQAGRIICERTGRRKSTPYKSQPPAMLQPVENGRFGCMGRRGQDCNGVRLRWRTRTRPLLEYVRTGEFRKNDSHFPLLTSICLNG